MIEEDLRQLRLVLARAVNASGLRVREIEEILGARHGSLARLLDGSQEIKVEHLTALARLLRIPPGDLLAAGCPALRAAASHRLADWIDLPGGTPALARPAETGAPSPSPTPTPEELTATVRSVLRRELAARKKPGRTAQSGSGTRRRGSAAK
jgi:hypothetical protein